MIVPIFLPTTPTIPDTCPDCGRVEDLKVTCRHCGHEYWDVNVEEEEDVWPGLSELMIILVSSLVGTWVVLTLLFWGYETTDTLVEVLGTQWEWIMGLGRRFMTLMARLW